MSKPYRGLKVSVKLEDSSLELLYFDSLEYFAEYLKDNRSSLETEFENLHQFSNYRFYKIESNLVEMSLDEIREIFSCIVEETS